MIPRILTFFYSCCLLLTAVTAEAASPKRDFRGAWIQTIYQGYDKRTTVQNQTYLIELLDNLHAAGINAVIFQVRPRADALYASEIEPWSRFLTGTVGKAPSPAWDPLQFMIDECHKRGMELHAWLNPYRAPTVEEAEDLSPDNMLKKHPERFVRYDKGYYFKPSLSVNRDLICQITGDIVERYDIDGIHFDDYFYPYPVAGKPFPDDKEYAAAKTNLSRGDWRRQNVDLLIEQVSRTIKQLKPWVRFGISPFGIWRNAQNDPRGSQTRGLQNYDDLYADVISWAKNGWIDYLIPQLYWDIEHRSAPYGKLCVWWADNGHGRHIYIGQDAEKTAKAGELKPKMQLVERYHDERIQGNCWWYAASLPVISDELNRNYYRAKALVPEYVWKKAEPANRPTGLKMRGNNLCWNDEPSARKWVVYCFASKDKIDISDPAAICDVVYTSTYKPKNAGVYVVTALNHANGESAPSQPIKVTL